MTVASVLFGFSFYALISWIEQGRLSDIPVYIHYAELMRHGGVPYRDFKFEYPPAALPAMLLPSYMSWSYATSFAVLMGVCGGACIAASASALSAVGAGTERTWAALLAIGISPLVLGSLFDTRFDLWPTLLALGALAAARPGAAPPGRSAPRARVRRQALAGRSAAARNRPPLAAARGIRCPRRTSRRSSSSRSSASCPSQRSAPHGLRAHVRRPARPAAPGGEPRRRGADGGCSTSGCARSRPMSTHGAQALSGRGAGLAADLSTVLEIATVAAIWIVFARRRYADGETLLIAAAARRCRTRRLRQGALAAVPHLARSIRLSGARGAWNRRRRPAAPRARTDADVVPRALLVARARPRSAVVVVPPRTRPRTRGARPACSCSRSAADEIPQQEEQVRRPLREPAHEVAVPLGPVRRGHQDVEAAPDEVELQAAGRTPYSIWNWNRSCGIPRSRANAIACSISVSSCVATAVKPPPVSEVSSSRTYAASTSRLLRVRDLGRLEVGALDEAQVRRERQQRREVGLAAEEVRLQDGADVVVAALAQAAVDAERRRRRGATPPCRCGRSCRAAPRARRARRRCACASSSSIERPRCVSLSATFVRSPSAGCGRAPRGTASTTARVSASS